MKILVIIYELKMSSNSQGVAIKRCVRITLVDNFLKSKTFASH